MKYEELHAEIRHYGMQEPPYDTNGVVHLMLAALDNLRENAFEVEMEMIADLMTDEQRFYLKKIADYACRRTDEEIEAEA